MGMLRAVSLRTVNGLTCRNARREHDVCGDVNTRTRRWTECVSG